MSNKRPRDASSPPGVVIDHAADVLTFTLDNPSHGNEVTGAMLDEMLIELRKEATKPRARVCAFERAAMFSARGVSARAAP